MTSASHTLTLEKVDAHCQELSKRILHEFVVDRVYKNSGFLLCIQQLDSMY